MRGTGAQRRRRASGVSGAALALALACGGSEEAAPRGAGAAAPPAAAARPAAPAAAAPSPEAALAEARQLFAARCATCHGAGGAGDGAASAGLVPAPRNFQDPQWQAAVSDEHIERIVLYGGAAVGRAPTMPGNPDLSGRPQLLAALVAHIRGLAPR